MNRIKGFNDDDNWFSQKPSHIYYMEGLRIFISCFFACFFLNAEGLLSIWTVDEWLWLQIGSFGAITRIVNIVPNREDLLKVAAAGPLAGFSVGIVLLLLGFIIPPIDGIGIIVDAGIFHESFLAGGIGKHL